MVQNSLRQGSLDESTSLLSLILETMTAEHASNTVNNLSTLMKFRDTLGAVLADNENRLYDVTASASLDTAAAHSNITARLVVKSRPLLQAYCQRISSTGSCKPRLLSYLAQGDYSNYAQCFLFVSMSTNLSLPIS